MLRVLRITLMWLVAFAVPIQGYAAVAMFGCGPGHHGMSGTLAQAVADDHDAVVPQDSGEAHAMVAADHDDSAEPNHVHMLDAHGTPDKVGKGSCTPCASCCVAAALPAAMVVFQPLALVDFFVPLAPRGLTSFLTEGPERPPRSILV